MRAPMRQNVQQAWDRKTCRDEGERLPVAVWRRDGECGHAGHEQVERLQCTSNPASASTPYFNFTHVHLLSPSTTPQRKQTMRVQGCSRVELEFLAPCSCTAVIAGCIRIGFRCSPIRLCIASMNTHSGQTRLDGEWRACISAAARSARCDGGAALVMRLGPCCARRTAASASDSPAPDTQAGE